MEQSLYSNGYNDALVDCCRQIYTRMVMIQKMISETDCDREKRKLHGAHMELSAVVESIANAEEK